MVISRDYWSTNMVLNNMTFLLQKTLTEKSRECPNHKQQPTPDTERKRKTTKTNTCKTNKQIHERHTDPTPNPSPSEVITIPKGTKKHEDKEHGKTSKHEAPRSIKLNATQNKNNTGTTAPERSAGVQIYFIPSKTHPWNPVHPQHTHTHTHTHKSSIRMLAPQPNPRTIAKTQKPYWFKMELISKLLSIQIMLS